MHLVSSANRNNRQNLMMSGISLTYMRNRSGPSILPCGIPDRTGRR